MNALVKPLAVILGLALVAAGVVGFGWVGAKISQDLTRIFSVNALHNTVHLASGAVALIAVAAGYGAARLYLIVFGLVYALVAVAGFAKIQQVVTLLHINQADNFLHAAIAVACLLVGLGSKR